MTNNPIQDVIDDLRTQGWSEDKINDFLAEQNAKNNEGVVKPIQHLDGLDPQILPTDTGNSIRPRQVNILDISKADSGAGSNAGSGEGHQGVSPVEIAARNKEISTVDKTLNHRGRA